jgi:hypothetical protein
MKRILKSAEGDRNVVATGHLRESNVGEAVLLA